MEPRRNGSPSLGDGRVGYYHHGHGAKPKQNWENRKRRNTSKTGSHGGYHANTLALRQQQLRRSVWNECIAILEIEDSRNQPQDLEKQVFQRLDGLVFPTKGIPREECGKMVGLLCRQEGINGHIDRLYEFVGLLCRKKSLSLSHDSLGVFIDLILRDLEKMERNHHRSLETLALVLADNADRCSKYYERLVCTLQAFKRDHPVQMLECMESLCKSSQMSGELSNTCFVLAQESFASRCSNETANDVKRAKVLSRSLLLMQRVLTNVNSNSSPPQPTWELIDKLKQCLGYGFQAKREEEDIAWHRRKGSRPSWTGGLGSLASLSESEVSDSSGNFKSGAGGDQTTDGSDSIASSSRLQASNTKVRISALDVLLCLCRVNPKLVQSNWERLIPTRNGTELNAQRPSVLTSLLHDQSSRVRERGALVLSALLEICPIEKWLGMNAGSALKRPTGFISLSTRVAFGLQEIHLVLVAALKTEKNPNVIAVLLKCTSALVKATPYGAIGDPARAWLSPLLQLAETNVLMGLVKDDKAAIVRDAASLCIGQLVTTEIPLETIREWLQDSLVAKLIQNRQLSLLGKCFHLYGELIIGLHWNRIFELLVEAFSDRTDSVRKSAVELLEAVVVCPTRAELDMPDWDRLISEHLPRALGDISSNVRASAAVCMSQLKDQDWKQVPFLKTRRCVDMLLQSTRSDILANTRMSSLRVLGSMALLDTFRVEWFFQNLFKPLMKCLEDQHALVRQRAAIAIGNLMYGKELCDREKIATLLSTSVEFQALDDMIQACLEHCNEQDKVSAPVLRALGHFLVLELPSHHLHKIASALCAKVKDGNAKVRWNSCNAIAYALETNPSNLPFERQNRDADDMEDDVLQILQRASSMDENYKVRMSAVNALVAPKSAEGYGNAAPFILAHLLTMARTHAKLESYSEEAADFLQYQYTQNLRAVLRQAILRLWELFPGLKTASDEETWRGL